MAAHNEFYEEISRDSIKDFQFISQGSFGIIYRARHQDWGIDVALKILSRSTSFTQKELLNEARAMVKARFLYVVRFYGICVDKLQLDNPSVGLVMEYMENGSLSDLMNQVNFIPWALRFRILFHVALGMNYLHSLSPPLLHLDLKLGNILLDAVLDAKVADFGLSKFKRGTIRSGSQASVEEEEYGGTLEYLPPEAFADPYKPTPGTDVYSYGIITWSLLSGEEPYSNRPSALRSLLKLHILQGQRPSTEKLEKITDVLKVQDVVKLMERCWHNDKVQRPSFRDCRQEMEAVSSCYQGHIMAAVHEVQNILVQKKNSSSSTPKKDSPATQCSEKVDFPSSLNPYAKNVEYQPPLDTSVGIEEYFKTLQVEESSYRPNEATPPATVSKTRQEGKPPAPTPLQRSQSEYIEKENEEASYEESHQPEVKFRDRLKPADGRPPRPHSHTYLYPPYSSGYQHYPQYMCLPPHQVDFGPASQDHSLLPHFDSRVPYGNIHISGHGFSGVQIGSHNTMHIGRTQTPREKQ
ncbi:receptor-interacting serine/threonine-protein kinase 3 isoform X2 [Anolis sagrei]|uniref:receptor-interacting serine/threonine-protein kinase 3 isoform X2 n=1 Tax=Anolis sagrei TaxID=38937 RepID=UPI003522DF92